jgi:hypothetical protein
MGSPGCSTCHGDLDFADVLRGRAKICVCHKNLLYLLTAGSCLEKKSSVPVKAERLVLRLVLIIDTLKYRMVE